MKTSSPEPEVLWKEPVSVWALSLVISALMGFVFFDGLKLMVEWWERPEYSHGYIIPFIAAFLIWQKKDKLEQTQFQGSWAGVILVVVGVLLYFAGELSTLYTIIQYAFLIVTAGIALTFMGWRAFKIIWVPLLILAFMVPLPTFLYNNLSAQLQLISSELGVAVIRMFNISVYLEGNVVDLGSYKLQVVEACSGLRYLFPLMTLGFIAAYFYKGAFWKRAVVFLSSMPITVLMNSFRIGVIGIMVDRWGRSMAEGFLHDFEGWAVFMACTGILVLEMWIFAHVGSERKPFREIFGLELPAPRPSDTAVIKRGNLPSQLSVSAAVLVTTAIAASLMGQRAEIIPARTDFSAFPMEIQQWHGKRLQMEQMYVDALKFDDYIMADFEDSDRHFVNFYVAYYRSQRKGESAHSPRTCIPGGGWEITSLTQRNIAEATVEGAPLTVNRAVIQKGDDRQLVYYWFFQRGRVITNEYLVKWYLFWDALTRNRTDGALVRVITTAAPGQSLEETDRQLSRFTAEVNPLLSKYVPE
jgi:exosortase D (VPLPA-CTERM-specific)